MSIGIGEIFGFGNFSFRLFLFLELDTGRGIWVGLLYEFEFSIRPRVLELARLDFSGQLRKILCRARNDANYILYFRGTFTSFSNVFPQRDRVVE